MQASQNPTHIAAEAFFAFLAVFNFDIGNRSYIFCPIYRMFFPARAFAIVTIA